MANRAVEILARRKAAQARRAEALSKQGNKIEVRVRWAAGADEVTTAEVETAGFLVAVGDSWFDYPFFDILKLLENDHGYNVESAAHRGDAIEQMAYHGGQMDQFARCLEKVTAHAATPKAFLISGGGDDIAGAEFAMLLNNAEFAIAGWNGDVLGGVIGGRIRTAYAAMIELIVQICDGLIGKTPPILIHGYDYPIPDGR